MGYLLGVVTRTAPGSWPGALDWRAKPHNYSAGVRGELAAAAVCAVLDGEVAGKRVLDPACGSGTMLFEAWVRGARAVGGEIEASLAGQARANLRAFSGACAEGHRARLAGVLSAPVPAPEVYAMDAADAGELLADDVPFDAVVCNVPDGKSVAVGGAPGRATDPLDALLAVTLPLAPRHAFVSARPLAPRLAALGFAAVSEACVCRTGKRYLAVARGRGAEPLCRVTPAS